MVQALEGQSLNHWTAREVPIILPLSCSVKSPLSPTCFDLSCILFVNNAILYLFLPVLGLRCCRGFSLLVSGGRSLAMVCRLLNEAAFLAVELSR